LRRIGGCGAIRLVELLTVGAVEAQALGGSGSGRYHAALEMALQVESQIEMARAHPRKKGHKGEWGATAVVDDQFIEPRMAFEHRL